MKKNIMIYLLMALVCFGLQSCLFQEEDYFDDSSANRATEEVKQYSELLESASNGWRMEYYIGQDYALGGITLLCKFDGQRVTMASQGYEGDETISSLYKVVSEEATMLTFDTYNAFIHAYAKPQGGGSNPNANLQGDYEFIIKEASAEKIVMQGKKYGNTIVMYALPDDLNWEAYINSVNDVEENAFFIQYQLLVDGNLVGMTQRSNYTFVIAYNDGGNIVQEQSPFLFTTDGFRFREPVSLAGVTVQNFVWDPSSELFTCTDEGATNVKMKGIYPEGYIKYNDYLGNYTLTCKMYKDNNLTDEELPISIIEDVENKSYILKGLIGDIVLDYDRGEGIMSFKTQKVGYISGYYLGCTTYCYAMGFYPTAPSSNIYNIGSPALESVDMRMSNGKHVKVTTQNWSPENVYIREMYLNGKKYDKSYLTYDDIREGATIHFVLSRKPNYRRAISDAAVPASLSETGKTLLYRPSSGR